MAPCQECESPQIGTLVHFKGGTKDLEFYGKDKGGKILLRDPKTGITYLVNTDEIMW